MISEMHLIKTITDKEILGTEGFSVKEPRLTARAILKNRKGQYAVMYSEEFHLYSLPGGGLERGEDAEDAIRREIWEETGCSIAAVEALGYVEENRAHCDYTQVNYYFVLMTDDEQFSPHMTANELKHGTTALWLDFPDLYHHIASAYHPTNQRKFLQARDVAALEEYIQRENMVIG